MKSKILKYTSWTFLFIFLTVLTQVGGVIWLLSELISKKTTVKFKGKRWSFFIATYLLFTFLIIPFIAPLFGREKIKHTARIYPTNYLTVILNRNYVKPELNKVLANIEKQLDPSINICYLDANFPFIKKFPLAPHLSHNDGKKLDISLVYQNKKGEISNLQKSMSGYGVFVEPKQGEFKQTDFCLENGYFQYDFSKYLTFGSIHDELTFSEKGTKQVVELILKQPEIEKVFLEKHIRTRLGITSPKFRFQGCGSVRHDDHIHLQLK